MSFDFLYLTWLAYLDFLLSLEPGLLLAEGGRRPRRGTEVRKKKKKLIIVVWDSTVGLLGFVWLLTFFIVRTIRSITFAWGNIRKFQHQRKFKLFLNLTFPWRCSFGLFGVVGLTNFDAPLSISILTSRLLCVFRFPAVNDHFNCSCEFAPNCNNSLAIKSVSSE